jgi:hypothetical protein
MDIEIDVDEVEINKTIKENLDKYLFKTNFNDLDI